MAMNMLRWFFPLGLALAAGPAIAGPPGCGLPEITGARELHRVLSLRAVDLVRQAASPAIGQTLIAPSANFSLGAGDVGRPFGTGIAGARQLAQTMKADTYRFLGWDAMDGPANACSAHKVDVEFIDSKANVVSRVTFTFEAGRVVSGVGWQRSFETGLIQDAPAL